jgi:hypothetical protein
MAMHKAVVRKCERCRRFLDRGVGDTASASAPWVYCVGGWIDEVEHGVRGFGDHGAGIYAPTRLAGLMISR